MRIRTLHGMILTAVLFSLLIGAVSTATAFGLGSQARSNQRQYTEQVAVTQDIELLRTFTTEVAWHSLQLTNWGGQALEEALKGSLDNLKATSKSLAARPLTEAEKPKVKAYLAALEAFTGFFGTKLDMAPMNDPAAAAKLIDQYNTILGNVSRTHDEVAALASKTLASVHQDSTDTTNRLVLVGGLLPVVIGVVLGVFLFWLTHRIKDRLGRITNTLTRLHGGDLTARVEASGADELAAMSNFLNQTLERLGQIFMGIGRTSTNLRESSMQLQEVAHKVGEAAGGAAQEAQGAANAAQEVSINIQSVASSSQEMGSAISEVSRNAAQAAAAAGGAVASVDATTEGMAKLSDSSREIGDVVRLITSIAEQTNLLALNATIEAARAGDAGKGFAVVADEVKQLAQETARATEDISRRVETIQADAKQATESITEIASVIGRINEFQTVVAAALEEQHVTTESINVNVSHAAGGANQIAESVGGVATAIEAAATAAGETQANSDRLADMSAELTELISKFRY